MQKFELSEFQALDLSRYVIVDTRESGVFAEAFIEDSVSIPFNDNFINTLTELVSDELKVLIVANETEIAAVVKMVKGSGLSHIKGYLAGGFEAWLNAGNRFDMLISIDADEFSIDYQFDEFYLIDLRDKEAFKECHIEDAENIALVDLEPVLVEMEATGMYYLYGETAEQAITAGSLLKKNGFERLRPVAADFEAIKASGVSLFTARKKGKSNSKNTEE